MAFARVMTMLIEHGQALGCVYAFCCGGRVWNVYFLDRFLDSLPCANLKFWGLNGRMSVQDVGSFLSAFKLWVADVF